MLHCSTLQTKSISISWKRYTTLQAYENQMWKLFLHAMEILGFSALISKVASHSFKSKFTPKRPNQKAFTGLDRKSAHPLQLHAVSRSCCTAANPGATGRLSPWVGMTTCCWFEHSTQGDSRHVAPGSAAVQQLRFTAWSCNGWADFLSNPVKAFKKSEFRFVAVGFGFMGLICKLLINTG